MQSLIIETKKEKEVVDITAVIDQTIASENSENSYLCNVFITHTTAAITTADLDPGTDLDMMDAFEKIIPKLNYRHPHDPTHTPDHILSSIIGTSLTIPVVKGKLFLGRWQRVVLVELDGPRNREVLINLI